MPISVLGWDIGGAHIKIAHCQSENDHLGAVSGWKLIEALEIPCPLWQGLDKLEVALREAFSYGGAIPHHALTMTGELADSFTDRGEGVRSILDCFQAQFSKTGQQKTFPDPVIYAGKRDFLDPQTACLAAHRVASANWQALGALVCDCLPQQYEGSGLLLDIGSTTTDILALSQGQPFAAGFDDYHRLQTGELVYSGVVRTPVMALAPGILFEDRQTPLMAELFATTADIYRLLGWLSPQKNPGIPADGGGKTLADSARRLARMIGLDAKERPPATWVLLAQRLADIQITTLTTACRRQIETAALPDSAPVIASGCGEFLAPHIAGRLQRPYIGIAPLLGIRDTDLAERAAICAPAVAVAWLAMTQGEWGKEAHS